MTPTLRDRQEKLPAEIGGSPEGVMEQLKAREKKMEAREKQLNARVTEFTAAKKKHTSIKASWKKKARANEIEIETRK